MPKEKLTFDPSLCLWLYRIEERWPAKRRTVVTLRQQREQMQLPNVSISNLAAKKQEEKDVKFGDVMKKGRKKRLAASRAITGSFKSGLSCGCERR